ncbi:hypothetical protein [Pseudoalteromonas sp. EB27]|uniref:hypothetical protein n=1 Tax=Pseudoalteromonas sp. EB27 TaxID=1938368 RepID=UPI000977D07F|nr:hypothetical protein [Pseudoalteromonas sp. EB27]
MRIFFILLIVSLTSCSKNIDSALTDKELETKFSEHKLQYTQLREMITDDSKFLQKFKVGNDRLGEYQLYDKGWAKQYGYYVSFVRILSEYKLTQTRYLEYLNLLSVVGASEIELYKGNVFVTLSSSGFVFGGCLSQIIYSPNNLKLERPSWAQVYYQAKLTDNWGGETKCN